MLLPSLARNSRPNVLSSTSTKGTQLNKRHLATRTDWIYLQITSSTEARPLSSRWQVHWSSRVLMLGFTSLLSPFLYSTYTGRWTYRHFLGSTVGMSFISQSSVLAHGIIFLILNPIFVAGRFWMRWKTKTWGLDDWLCIPALVIIALVGSFCTQRFWLNYPDLLPVGGCPYDYRFVCLSMHRWYLQCQGLTHIHSGAVTLQNLQCLRPHQTHRKNWRRWCWIRYQTGKTSFPCSHANKYNS